MSVKRFVPKQVGVRSTQSATYISARYILMPSGYKSRGPENWRRMGAFTPEVVLPTPNHALARKYSYDSLLQIRIDGSLHRCLSIHLFVKWIYPSNSLKPSNMIHLNL